MTFLFVCAFLGSCSLCDLKTGRIPNRLLVFWWFFFLAESVFSAAGRGPVSFIAGTVFMAAVLFPFSVLRMFGAGDIKTAAVLSGAAGLPMGAAVLFSGLFLSAVFSFFFLVRKHLFCRRFAFFFTYISQLLQTGRALPYLREESDREEAGFCFVPFLFLGYLLCAASGGGSG